MATEMNTHEILRRPIITEKSTKMQERQNAYPFEVAIQATKPEIKKAVEDAFAVRVIDVNTMIMKGKPRRVRVHVGYTSMWKKAIVTLHPDDRIDLF